MLLGIHVDDGIIASTNLNWTKKVIKQIRERYTLGECKPLEWYLGMGIKFNPILGIATITSERYIEELARRFGITDERVRSVSTPADPGVKLRVKTDDEELTEQPYLRLVGALIYLSITTRPDITTAVNACSRFMSAPTEKHWKAAKRILVYAYGT